MTAAQYALIAPYLAVIALCTWWLPRHGRTPDQPRRGTPPGWAAVVNDTGRYAHLHPVVDAVVHTFDLDGDCVCGPTAHAIRRADGSDGWLYQHHALDGRPAPARTR